MLNVLTTFLLTLTVAAASICPCPSDAPQPLSKSIESFRGAITGNDVVAGLSRTVSITARKYTVVVFLSAKCPCSASHEETLRSLSEQYGTKNFQFVGVHSNSDEPADLTKNHFMASRFPFPIIQDTNNTVADLFGALKTPHVYVINQSGSIVYQGGIDDSHNAASARRHYLSETLSALESGREPTFKDTRTLGCAIKR